MRQLNPEYSFYFASDGEEGLMKAEEVVPDLIITDVMMPLIDDVAYFSSVFRKMTGMTPTAFRNR